MPDDSGPRAWLAPRAGSVESRASWVAACVTLAILSVSYGGPLLVVVGLKTIQEDLGTERSTLALAGALVWVGTGLGGILMGRVADRIGMRATALIGACMMAAGLAISATGSLAAIFIGHALLIGLLGNGALYPPLVTYVSRWFDRKRGTAIALISSGQYVAGVVWPYRSNMAWRASAGAPSCWRMPGWCWRRLSPWPLCSCARRHSRHAVPPAPWRPAHRA